MASDVNPNSVISDPRLENENLVEAIHEVHEQSSEVVVHKVPENNKSEEMSRSSSQCKLESCARDRDKYMLKCNKC